MKCTQALEAMLDAEPADLLPEGSAALALHLRSCVRCARVAATMRADVHALAAVMPAVPAGSTTPWVRWPGVALACATAVLLFVVLRARPEATVRSQPADATPVVVARPPETVQASIPTRTTPATTSGRRAASARYAMPDPAPLGVPDDLHERAATVPAFKVPASELAFNGVSASSNGRVTVLNTANPKITVIWFN